MNIPMSSSKPDTSLTPSKTPPNRGRIIVEHNNTETLRFWIRVFELQSQIAFAQSRFNETRSPEGKGAIWAMVPIISEYDAGHIKWIYALVLELDVLGVCGGTGIIFYADKQHEEQAREARDEFAQTIMEAAERRTKDGCFSELFITKSGAQE